MCGLVRLGPLRPFRARRGCLFLKICLDGPQRHHISVVGVLIPRGLFSNQVIKYSAIPLDKMYPIICSFGYLIVWNCLVISFSVHNIFKSVFKECLLSRGKHSKLIFQTFSKQKGNFNK